MVCLNNYVVLYVTDFGRLGIDPIETRSINRLFLRNIKNPFSCLIAFRMYYPGEKHFFFRTMT